MGLLGPLVDSSPTMREWPVSVRAMEEVPERFAQRVAAWAGENFGGYTFVYAPRRRTAPDSFAYLFGYGQDRVLFLREEGDPVEVCRDRIRAVTTRRELLNAVLTLEYLDRDRFLTLDFPYVPSVYYLYDPFLNWCLGLEKDFTPALAERQNPRPQALYQQSLAMFNYSLHAYRLGNGFSTYEYRSQTHRHKWLPWRTFLEEWLETDLERGHFSLHCCGYLTECGYRPHP